MAKSTAENSHALSIFWLNKHGYLDKDYSYKSGIITWTSGFGNKSNVAFSIVKDDWGTTEEKICIELKYTHTDRWTNEKSDMDFKIPIATTSCNYGGKRYWFVCPLTKNEQYCGRQVGVIYSIDKWFGCRHCGEIAYNSQMSGGRFRGSSVCVPDIEKAEQEVKRYYYNGKPTRKYRRVMRLNKKLDQWFVLLAARTDKRFARFAGLNK